MNQKELKSVIKQLVRESLTEIFAEMKLESIVEGVIKKNNSVSRDTGSAPARPITESVQHDDSANMRSKIREMVGADDSEWADIYKDTVENGHAILDNDEGSNPEFVSESLLQKHGLMKDYSKFMK